MTQMELGHCRMGMGNLILLTPDFSPVTESVQMKNRFNGLFGADGKFQVVAERR
jgi:hypothetical protein